MSRTERARVHDLELVSGRRAGIKLLVLFHLCIRLTHALYLQPTQRVMLDQGGNRFVVNDKDMVTSSENKSRLLSIDHALIGHHYDLRIGVASEANLVDESANKPMSTMSFVRERIKKRTTYRCLSDPELSPWKVDITDTASCTIAANGTRTAVVDNGARSSTVPSSRLRDTELEVEMKRDAMLALFDIIDPAHVVEHIKKLIAGLLRLIDILIPAEPEPVLRHASVRQLPSPIPASYSAQINKINEMLQRAAGLVPSNTGSNMSFLGSTPLNMNRRSLLSVQSEPYFFTEKSDGLRNFLYVIQGEKGPLALLMSRGARDIKLFEVSGGSLIGTALGVGTVLDGELVHNRSLKRTVFLVFDVLSIDSRVLVAEPFRRRLEALNREVMAKCSQIERLYHQERKAANNPSLPIPLELIRKTYYGRPNKTSLSDLVAKIKVAGGEYIYHDSDRRHHLVDGIIFQPADCKYTFGNDPALLKWKWSELRSVDLLTRYILEAGRVALFCTGPDSILIELTKRSSSDFTCFGRFDQYRLLADIFDGSLPQKQARIAEVVYDVGCGVWRYIKLRKDKEEPNYIDTVLGVMQEQAEDISLEELELYCMLADVEPSAQLTGATAELRSFASLDQALRQSWRRCKQDMLARLKAGPAPAAT